MKLLLNTDNEAMNNNKSIQAQNYGFDAGFFIIKFIQRQNIVKAFPSDADIRSENRKNSHAFFY